MEYDPTITEKQKEWDSLPQAQKNLRSNLQKAQTARSLTLMTGERDFDKRANGVNAALPNALVGDLDPKLFLKQERPVHRTMINMAAAGYTNTEIAVMTGRNHTTVANAIKQPWAREYLINEAKKTVQDEIKQLLEQEAIPSLKVLIAVRDDEKARSNDKITASNSLLDRFLGKPVQPINSDAKLPSEMSDDELREQIQRELAATQPN